MTLTFSKEFIIFFSRVGRILGGYVAGVAGATVSGAAAGSMAAGVGALPGAAIGFVAGLLTTGPALATDWGQGKQISPGDAYAAQSGVRSFNNTVSKFPTR